MKEDEKLALVDQAITALEKLSDSNVTPLAVLAWLTLHAHIDLSLNEISRSMQIVYQKRGEHSSSTPPFQHPVLQQRDQYIHREIMERIHFYAIP